MWKIQTEKQKRTKQIKRTSASYPAGIYLLKVNNRNTRTRREICSNLTTKTPGRRQWCRSAVFIVNFEHISHLVLLFYIVNFEHANAGFLVSLLKQYSDQHFFNIKHAQFVTLHYLSIICHAITGQLLVFIIRTLQLKQVHNTSARSLTVY